MLKSCCISQLNLLIPPHDSLYDFMRTAHNQQLNILPKLMPKPTVEFMTNNGVAVVVPNPCAKLWENKPIKFV